MACNDGRNPRWRGPSLSETWPSIGKYTSFLTIGALFLGLSACADPGSVRITLLLPDDPALAPDTEQLASITMIAWPVGEPAERQSRVVTEPGQSLDMGALLADREVRLAVQLRSATDRLLGYGTSPEAIAPIVGEDQEVLLQIRRPYVFASGATDRLDAFDSTADGDDPNVFSRVVMSAPLASAATPDGAELVVVSQSGSEARIQLVDTANHELASSASIAIPGQVTGVTISANGQLALVAHGGAEGGVSAIDLEAARAGTAQVAFAAIGNVGEVVAAPAAPGRPERAYALIDRAGGFGCDDAPGPSTVATIRLEGNLPLDDSHVMAEAVSDLALGGDGQALFVAEPCSGRLSALDLDSAGIPETAGSRSLVELERASSVAVLDDRLWGAGAITQTADRGARLAIIVSDLSASDVTRVELPPSQERAESTDFDESGQRVEVRMDADRLRAYDLVALPGANRVALLAEGYYHAEESGDAFGTPIIPELEITTFEYLLVDVSSRAVVQRLRTSCEGYVLSDAVFTAFRCGEDSDQDVLRGDDQYQPAQLSALYGGK